MRTRGKGRPRRFRNATQLRDKMQEYFDLCDRNNRAYTLSGLALYLGFASTRSLKRYGSDCKAASHFRHTIGWAWLQVEDQKHQRLLKCDGAAARGLIFDLVQNHGWKVPKAKETVGEQKQGRVTVRELGMDQWAEMWREEQARKAVRKIEGGRAS
jgi:hypothetical protein